LNHKTISSSQRQASAAGNSAPKALKTTGA